MIKTVFKNSFLVLVITALFLAGTTVLSQVEIPPTGNIAEIEPNGNKDNAQLIGVPSKVVDAEILKNEDGSFGVNFKDGSKLLFSDLYKLKLEEKNNLIIKLEFTKNSTTADLDLFVLDTDIKTLESSTLNGNKDESIQAELDPGEYFIAVGSFKGSTIYDLSVDVFIPGITPPIVPSDTTSPNPAMSSAMSMGGMSGMAAMLSCSSTSPTSMIVEFPNFGTQDAVVSIRRVQLACPEFDSFPASNLSTASFVGGSINNIGLELPSGLYDFCVRFDGEIEDVNGTKYQRYKHQIIKKVFVEDGDGVQTVGINPGGSGSKKGSCNNSEINGGWIGMAIPNNPAECQSADLAIEIDFPKFVGNAVLEDGTNVKLRAMIAKDGTIKKGAFAVGMGVAAKFNGVIDFDNGVGAGKYKERNSRCVGVFEINKNN